MARIRPRNPLELGEQKPLLDMMEAAMGFTPSSLLTMAHWPELLSAMAGAFGVILGPGELDPGLKRLISFVTSNAAGCRYCQAHTSHAAERAGVSAEKIAAQLIGGLVSVSASTNTSREAVWYKLYSRVCPRSSGASSSWRSELK